jgi:hypothetical protein
MGDCGAYIGAMGDRQASKPADASDITPLGRQKWWLKLTAISSR